MKMTKGRRDDIFQLATDFIREMNYDDLIVVGDTDAIEWDAFIKELQPRLEDMIAKNAIVPSEVFYMGWWFGDHTYGDYIFKQERRDEIFKSIADPAVDEIISRGMISPGATDDGRWDAFIKEWQPRLEKRIATRELDLLDVFYIGWWFGFRGCP